MVHVSLVLNVAVLIPVLWSLLGDSSGAADAFGPDQPARRILVAVYLAIAALSVVLLAWPAGRVALAPGLLTVQVVYKIATLPLLGIGHPVALANLGIAAVHAGTLWTLTR
ncbi:MAG: hypothetical protein AAF264_13750 [Pseudomonadota bacterium]